MRRLALLLETRTGGTVLLLPALILKPFSCLSLPHQTATCLNLIVLLFKTHYILHRILITPLQKITYPYTWNLHLHSYMNLDGQQGVKWL